MTAALCTWKNWFICQCFLPLGLWAESCEFVCLEAVCDPAKPYDHVGGKSKLKATKHLRLCPVPPTTCPCSWPGGFRFWTLYPTRIVVSFDNFSASVYFLVFIWFMPVAFDAKCYHMGFLQPNFMAT